MPIFDLNFYKTWDELNENELEVSTETYKGLPANLEFNFLPYRAENFRHITSAGIYLIIQDNSPSTTFTVEQIKTKYRYVGQTINIYHRLKQHLSGGYYGRADKAEPGSSLHLRMHAIARDSATALRQCADSKIPLSQFYDITEKNFKVCILEQNIEISADTKIAIDKTDRLGEELGRELSKKSLDYLLCCINNDRIGMTDPLIKLFDWNLQSMAAQHNTTLDDYEIKYISEEHGFDTYKSKFGLNKTKGGLAGILENSKSTNEEKADAMWGVVSSTYLLKYSCFWPQLIKSVAKVSTDSINGYRLKANYKKVINICLNEPLNNSQPIMPPNKAFTATQAIFKVMFYDNTINTPLATGIFKTREALPIFMYMCMQAKGLRARGWNLKLVNNKGEWADWSTVANTKFVCSDYQHFFKISLTEATTDFIATVNYQNLLINYKNKNFKLMDYINTDFPKNVLLTREQYNSLAWEASQDYLTIKYDEVDSLLKNDQIYIGYLIDSITKGEKEINRVACITPVDMNNTKKEILGIRGLRKNDLQKLQRGEELHIIQKDGSEINWRPVKVSPDEYLKQWLIDKTKLHAQQQDLIN